MIRMLEIFKYVRYKTGFKVNMGRVFVFAFYETFFNFYIIKLV